MEYLFYFQSLDIYKLSKEIVKDTYALTSKFPASEKLCLISQMNRAAVSIPSNIAEGVARNTKKDKVHYLNISFASMMELICQTEISKDLGYITDNELLEFSRKIKNCAIKISNYVAFLENESSRAK